MKNAAIIISTILAVLGVGYVVSQRKSDQEKGLESGKPENTLPLPPPPPPPPTGQNDFGKPLDPFSGDGLKAIESRMTSINQSGQKQSLIDSLDFDWYAGIPTETKTDFQQIISSILGDKYPLKMVNLSNTYLKYLKGIKAQTKIDDLNQLENDLSKWQAIVNYRDYEFLPSDFRSRFIDKGIYEVSGSADKNRSERYAAYLSDLITFAGNMVRLNEKYEQALRNKAISDLLASGYKFIGF